MRAWLAVYLLAHLLDALTTAAGLHAGGRELNPALAYLLASYGEVGAYAVKLGVALLTAGALVTLRWRRWTLPAACGVVLAVVGSNAVALAR